MKRFFLIVLSGVVLIGFAVVLFFYLLQKNKLDWYMRGYFDGRFVSASVCASANANALYGNKGRVAHEQRMLSDIASWIYWGITHRGSQGVVEELEHDIAIIHAFIKDPRSHPFVEAWRMFLSDDDFAFLSRLMAKEAPSFENVKIFGSYGHDNFEHFDIDRTILELNEQFQDKEYSDPVKREDIERNIYCQWEATGESIVKDGEMDLFYLLKTGEILMCPMTSNFILRAEITKRHYQRIIIDKDGKWSVEFEKEGAQ